MGFPLWPIREYPATLGRKIAELIEDFKRIHYGAPCLPADPRQIPSPELIFLSMDWENHWYEAELVSVVRYLRGGQHLEIPEAFRPMLPEKL